MLRWGSLGELSLFDSTWGQEVSGGPVSWTRLPTSEAQAWQLAGVPRPCQTLSQVRGEFLAFWEVWGLLPAFSRCSVGAVPHVDVFLMYLWGGRWSARLTPLPSWRSLPLLANLDCFHKNKCCSAKEFFSIWLFKPGYHQGMQAHQSQSKDRRQEPQIMQVRGTRSAVRVVSLKWTISEVEKEMGIETVDNQWFFGLLGTSNRLIKIS